MLRYGFSTGVASLALGVSLIDLSVLREGEDARLAALERGLTVNVSDNVRKDYHEAARCTLRLCDLCHCGFVYGRKIMVVMLFFQAMRLPHFENQAFTLVAE